MSAESKAAEAINKVILSLIQNNSTIIRTGAWVSAETVDANLSVVQSGDVTFRYVPKLESVSPSAGDTVVMVASPSNPMFILGVLVGNTTLAEV